MVAAALFLSGCANNPYSMRSVTNLRDIDKRDITETCEFLTRPSDTDGKYKCLNDRYDEHLDGQADARDRLDNKIGDAIQVTSELAGRKIDIDLSRRDESLHDAEDDLLINEDEVDEETFVDDAELPEVVVSPQASLYQNHRSSRLSKAPVYIAQAKPVVTRTRRLAATPVYKASAQPMLSRSWQKPRTTNTGLLTRPEKISILPTRKRVAHAPQSRIEETMVYGRGYAGKPARHYFTRAASRKFKCKYSSQWRCSLPWESHRKVTKATLNDLMLHITSAAQQISIRKESTTCSISSNKSNFTCSFHARNFDPNRFRRQLYK